MNKKMYVSPIQDTILIEQAILSADSMKVHVDDTKPEDEVKDVECGTMKRNWSSHRLSITITEKPPDKTSGGFFILCLLSPHTASP